MRNGGHSYVDESLLDNGVVIDLILLTKLDVNNEAGTITVGAGWKLGPLYNALAGIDGGYVAAGGTCVGVGASGLALGGG